MNELPNEYWIFHAVAFVVALGLLIAALLYRRKKHLIDDLPTSKVQGVFIGLVELKGTAETENPLTSELAAERCVYYTYRVEEHWRRTETETYRDKDGKTKTRKKTRSGWKTVRQHTEEQPFYLRDDTGVIRVLPEGAKVEGDTVFSRTVGQGDPLYYDKGPRTAIADSTYERRFVEQAVPLHKPLYLVGKARERDDIVAPEIAHDPTARMFLISTRTAEQVSRGYAWASWGLALGGALALGAGQFFFWQEHAPATLSPYLSLLPWWLGYISFWFFGWLWITYNSLVDLHQRLRRAWSQVDVQLKRRSTLIPKIVSVVRGLKEHEGTVQTTLAELRTQAEATEPGESGPDPRGCSGKIRALKEAYPTLKSDEAFLNLQKELSSTEQRIALARGYFNEVCTFYNTRLGIIPDGWIAKLGRFQPHPLISAEDFERAPVPVNLADD